MTIRKGEPWGSVVAAPPHLPVFDNERECHGMIERSFGAGPAERIGIGLRAGDLARTMGGGTPRRFEGDVVCAPVDVLRVTLDGVVHHALAHVVLRRSRRLGWLRGRVVLAMNAQYLGAHDVAPRSHPNDGRVDVIDIGSSMSVRSRLQARARSESGTHLPHPDIAVASVQRWQVKFERLQRCWVDGRFVGSACTVEIEVLPDALQVYA